MLSRFFLITLFYSFLILKSYAQPPMAMPVEVAPVKIDTVKIEVTAIGTLRAQESVAIRSEIPGRILRIHFSETRPVEKGDPLVTLDPAEYQAQLAESTAEVKLNELSYERIKDVFNRKLVSRQDLDEARAKLDSSLARQALEQVRLEKTVIRAPFKGTVGLRNISEGAYIDENQLLTTLGNSSMVKLDFRIPEKFLPSIQFGQAVLAQVDAYPEKIFRGELYASDIVVEETTRTLLLRAKLPNPKGELFTGMFARVRLTLATRDAAILIPEQAIVPQGHESFVFKVVKDKAVLTKVTLGERRSGEVEILTGLTHQDQVITAGQMKLFDGATVKVVSTEGHLDRVVARPIR